MSPSFADTSCKNIPFFSFYKQDDFGYVLLCNLYTAVTSKVKKKSVKCNRNLLLKTLNKRCIDLSLYEYVVVSTCN